MPVQIPIHTPYFGKKQSFDLPSFLVQAPGATDGFTQNVRETIESFPLRKPLGSLQASSVKVIVTPEPISYRSQGATNKNTLTLGLFTPASNDIHISENAYERLQQITPEEQDHFRTTVQHELFHGIDYNLPDQKQALRIRIGKRLQQMLHLVSPGKPTQNKPNFSLNPAFRKALQQDIEKLQASPPPALKIIHQYFDLSDLSRPTEAFARVMTSLINPKGGDWDAHVHLFPHTADYLMQHVMPQLKPGFQYARFRELLADLKESPLEVTV